MVGLVCALEPIVDQIRELASQIRAALAAHVDAEVFKPLFRQQRTAICPATLIAEIGDCGARYPTEAALAADAGMSPVAVECSGVAGRSEPPISRSATAISCAWRPNPGRPMSGVPSTEGLRSPLRAPMVRVSLKIGLNRVPSSAIRRWSRRLGVETGRLTG